MRCCALDGNGRQCRATGVGTYSYSGDGEIYDYDRVKWVVVPFCFKHIPSRDETHVACMRRMRRQQKMRSR